MWRDDRNIKFFEKLLVNLRSPLHRHQRHPIHLLAHWQVHFLQWMMLNALSHRKQARSYFHHLDSSDSSHILVQTLKEPETMDQYRLYIFFYLLEGIFDKLRYDLT